MTFDDHSTPGCRASRAFIGIGSNLGDRFETMCRAVAELADAPGVESLSCSPVYETRPVGPVGPTLFLNAVLEIEVRLSPMQLLHCLQDIEEKLGRRPPRGGPRPIDLDLLFYDDLVFQSGELIVPHPRLYRREFVLRPLRDLAPDFCHPECGSSVSELLDGLESRDEIVQKWPESIAEALQHSR